MNCDLSGREAALEDTTVGPKALDHPCTEGLPGETVPQRERRERSSSLRFGREHVHRDELLAIVLPDPIWGPIDSFRWVCEAAARSHDGPLRLPPDDGREIDQMSRTGDRVTSVGQAAAAAAGIGVIGWKYLDVGTPRRRATPMYPPGAPEPKNGAITR